MTSLRRLALAALAFLFAAPTLVDAQNVYEGGSGPVAPLSVQRRSTGATVVQDVPVFGTLEVNPYTGSPAGYTSFRLATNQTITSGGCTTPVANIAGGSYLATIVATAWNASTVTLQALSPDGTTYLTVTGASWTANATLGVVVGANATLRLCAAGGSPTGVNALLS